MNIFMLDSKPELAAQYHYDIHIVKMILESAQILCTVNHKCGLTTPYKPTHKNHPCTIWAGLSLKNNFWLRQLAFCLNEEYKRRFNHSVNHKSFDVIKLLDVPNLEVGEFTTPALAMPEEFITTDPIESYRNYYAFGKKHLLKYTNTNKPEWLIERLKMT